MICTCTVPNGSCTASPAYVFDADADEPDDRRSRDEPDEPDESLDAEVSRRADEPLSVDGSALASVSCSIDAAAVDDGRSSREVW